MTRWINEGPCIIDGCEKPMRARRWCNMHYSRWKAYGDPEYVTRPHRLDGAICDIAECGARAISKGLCKRHYSRQWKTGTTDLTGNRTTDPEERFKRDTRRDGECLIWIGAKMPSGYGGLRANGKVVYAHRYAWERERGRIPDDRVIDHICHNRACVNINHLRLATARQNAWNKGGAMVTSRTGVRNVSMTPYGTYFIQLRSGGEAYCLHGYRTLEEARRDAEALRAELFGEFAGRS